MIFKIVDIFQYKHYVCLNRRPNFLISYKSSFNTNIKIFGRNIKTARIFGENPWIFSAIRCPISHSAFARTSPLLHLQSGHFRSTDLKLTLILFQLTGDGFFGEIE